MAYFYLFLGFVLLMVSGNYLVKGSVQLARHFKVSTLVVGLTVVAFGTSAPEFFVSIKAALKDVPDIAVGNVVGSNIANIGLILGMVALVYPISIHNKSILSDALLMILGTVVLLFFGYNGVIGLVEGILLFSALMAYILWLFYQSKKKGTVRKEIHPPDMSIFLALAYTLISIAGLYFGAEWMVNGARELALSWGVSDRVIGISIVAFGTSVPELVTSIIAAFRKESDISIGNIIGSNIFNILGVLGASAMIKPLPVNNPEMFVTDMVWALGLSVALLLFMMPFNKGHLSRWKGGVFLSTYIIYIYLLFR
jgi:cation:H+ antiporter